MELQAAVAFYQSYFNYAWPGAKEKKLGCGNGGLNNAKAFEPLANSENKEFGWV